MLKIGVLTLTVGRAYGQKGFYNQQDLGVAKALAELGNSVILYKPDSAAKNRTILEESGNLSVEAIPCRNIKGQGKPDYKFISKNLDAIVCFSDNQLSVPSFYRWCQKNNIKFYPYIGVLESHSKSCVIKCLMDTLLLRDIAVYKKNICFAKTTTIQNEMLRFGVSNSRLVPVGLDENLLNPNYKASDVLSLKEKYDYKSSDKVILFVGRLEEEKRPLLMMDLFLSIYEKDDSYRLLIVGHGQQSTQVQNKIESLGLSQVVKLIDKIPNGTMWELYRFANCVVNLCPTEIFGMTILEAMYYECPVIASIAPGPKMIIKDGINGRLLDDDNDIIAAVLDEKSFPSTHEYVCENYMWSNTAQIIQEIIKSDI